MVEAEPEHIDLRELEFGSDGAAGVALSHWVDHLRERVRASGRVIVHHCPQMLAHTLYKTGMLRDGRVVLVDAREEEPYG
jgi:hypothetical protein